MVVTNSGAPADSPSLLAGVPDPRPPKRIVDGHVLRRFRESGQDCLVCGYSHVQPHHLILKSQGGDDCLENLVPLCQGCHGALHGTPCRTFGHRIDSGFVQSAIARYLASESGEDALSYLRSKRSDGWISTKFGVEL